MIFSKIFDPVDSKLLLGFDENFDLGLKTSLIFSSILILIYFIYPSILNEIVSTIVVY